MPPASARNEAKLARGWWKWGTLYFVLQERRRTPSLGQARGTHKAHELHEAEHTDHPKDLELGDAAAPIIARDGFEGDEIEGRNHD